jgi:hypothetical protein
LPPPELSSTRQEPPSNGRSSRVSSDSSAENVYAAPSAEVGGGAETPRTDPLRFVGWFFLGKSGLLAVVGLGFFFFGMAVSWRLLLPLVLGVSVGWALLTLGRKSAWLAWTYLTYDLGRAVWQLAQLVVGSQQPIMIALLLESPAVLLNATLQFLPCALSLVGKPGPKRRRLAITLFVLSLVLQLASTIFWFKVRRYGL